MKTFFQYIALTGVALAATLSCNKEHYGDDPKPWDETAEFFESADEKGFSTYYTPAIGRVGDPMPFYDSKAGEFKVLYLQEFDNNATYNFHPIWGVGTKDGASYTSLGEVLPVGASIWEQDAAIGTGCWPTACTTSTTPATTATPPTAKSSSAPLPRTLSTGPRICSGP